MPREDDYIARPRETRRGKLTRSQRLAQRRPPRGSISPLQRQIARGLNGDSAGGPIAAELALPENRVGDLHERFVRKTLLRFAELFPSPARQPIVVAALARLGRVRSFWINDWESWSPPRADPTEQAWSLACHLLARYPVPRWLQAAWVGRDGFSFQARIWFVHLGGGRNLRDALALPYALTRQMAHWATLAPGYLTPGGAIRYGQMRALGVDERAAVAVAQTRLSQPQRDEGFWADFSVWYSANFVLCWRQVDVIVDYLHAQRFGNFGRAPWPEIHPGDFTGVGLIGIAARWQARRAELRGLSEGSWRRSGIKGLEHRLPSNDVVRIIELNTADQLKFEGDQLDHCVFNYCDRARSGECAIFSLRYRVGSQLVPELTIEVLLPDRLIVQVRGLSNRAPRSDEMEIIHQWAAAARLRVDPDCGD